MPQNTPDGAADMVYKLTTEKLDQVNGKYIGLQGTPLPIEDKFNDESIMVAVWNRTCDYVGFGDIYKIKA